MSDLYGTRGITLPGSEGDRVNPDANRAALDDLCRPSGYLWWSHNGSLMFRKRDWYDHRPYEPPAGWLKSVASRIAARANSPTFSDLESLLVLTPEHLTGLMSLPTDSYVNENDQLGAINGLIKAVVDGAGIRNARIPFESTGQASHEPAHPLDLTAGRRNRIARAMGALGAPLTAQEIAQIRMSITSSPKLEAGTGTFVPIDMRVSFGAASFPRRLVLPLPLSLKDARVEVTPQRAVQEKAPNP
jgi:hypothetical protein